MKTGFLTLIILSVSFFAFGSGIRVTGAAPSQSKVYNPAPIEETLSKPNHADEVRLVMVSLAGCPFCLRFEQQIGHAYTEQPIAQQAPLVRVRFGSESLALFEPIKVTPTFLILQGTQELGRIAGYPGRDYFLEELELILVTAGRKPKTKNKDAPL